MKAIILAGGTGTRLKEVVNDLPPSMAMVAGKPFLEHQIRLLKEQGITKIIIAVHFMKEIIKSYFGSGLRYGVEITYSEEEVLMGTAGAIKKAEKYIDDTFLVLNGDSYSKINLNEFIDYHNTKKNKFTIALTETNFTNHHGNVLLDGDKILDFENKTNFPDNSKKLINSGVYLFEPIIFDYIEKNKYTSLEKDIFPDFAKKGLLKGYVYNGYFMDISRPETYQRFKKDILNNLLLNPDNSVREAMDKISKNGIDLILVVDPGQRLMGVVNDRIIRNFILTNGDVEGKVSNAMITELHKTAKISDDKKKIFDILFSGTRHLPILDDEGRLMDVEFRSEKIKVENYPVVRGKSPLRISFAGGGTDLPVFFEKHGGVVINCTIDKYCYGTLIKRADSKIIINSDIKDEFFINSKEDIILDGNFDLIKAIIKLMNPDFGFELYIHNDLPPGRGLGSSASMAVLLIRLIGSIQGIEYDDYKIAELAHKSEVDLLNIKGGWQDQYAAVTGGFNFMEFNDKKTLIYPLRLKQSIIDEFNHHLLLCYVKKSHFSGDLQKVLEDNFKKSDEEIINSLNDLKEIAIEIKDCLLTNNLEKIGQLLHRSWENKKKMSSAISNPSIDRIYEIGLQNGANGGKLLGAGAGGYILFFCPPIKRNILKKALESEGGEVTNFNFEFHGTKIWNSQRNNCFN